MGGEWTVGAEKDWEEASNQEGGRGKGAEMQVHNYFRGLVNALVNGAKRGLRSRKDAHENTANDGRGREKGRGGNGTNEGARVGARAGRKTRVSRKSSLSSAGPEGM